MNIKSWLILSLLCIVSPLELYADNCRITATSVSFGNYNIFSSVPTDSTGSVMVSCNKSNTVTISINAGNSGNFLRREMMPLAGGTDRLGYNLFTNASLTSVWGDGTGSSSVVSTVVPDKWIPITVNIYGRMPAGQDVRVGGYMDTLTATVIW